MLGTCSISIIMCHLYNNIFSNGQPFSPPKRNSICRKNQLKKSVWRENQFFYELFSRILFSMRLEGTCFTSTKPEGNHASDAMHYHENCSEDICKRLDAYLLYKCILNDLCIALCIALFPLYIPKITDFKVHNSFNVYLLIGACYPCLHRIDCSVESLRIISKISHSGECEPPQATAR